MAEFFLSVVMDPFASVVVVTTKWKLTLFTERQAAMFMISFKPSLFLLLQVIPDVASCFLTGEDLKELPLGSLSATLLC